MKVISTIAVSVFLATAAGTVLAAGRTEQSRLRAVQTTMDALAAALEQFHRDNGFHPTTEQGLAALRDKPTTPPIPPNYAPEYGCYLRKAVPRDPWGSAYQYLCPGVHNNETYDLWCVGRDGISGTDDDRTNWQAYPVEPDPWGRSLSGMTVVLAVGLVLVGFVTPVLLRAWKR